MLNLEVFKTELRNKDLQGKGTIFLESRMRLAEKWVDRAPEKHQSYRWTRPVQDRKSHLKGNGE